jgi:hypothetical protein
MIYYISTDYVRNNLPVDYSLLEGNITPGLQQAHFINARDLCGDKLFNQINNMISGGTINDAENHNYKYLLDEYLQDVVLYWTQYYLTTNLLAKYANKALSTNNSEFSSNADLSVYRTMKQECRDLATYYSERCKNWLYWNQNLFPEYTYMILNGDQPANPRDKYNAGGMVLGQRARWSRNNQSFTSWSNTGNCC